MERRFKNVILIDENDQGQLIARPFSELKIIKADGTKYVGNNKPINLRNVTKPIILQNLRFSPGKTLALSEDSTLDGGSYQKIARKEFLEVTKKPHTLDDLPNEEENY